MSPNSDDLRERIKYAALEFCAEAGLDADEATGLLRLATASLEKSAKTGAGAGGDAAAGGASVLSIWRKAFGLPVAAARVIGWPLVTTLAVAPLAVGALGGYAAAKALSRLSDLEAGDVQDREIAEAYRRAALQVNLSAAQADKRRQEKKRFGGGLAL